jgi:hypothetical protein
VRRKTSNVQFLLPFYFAANEISFILEQIWAAPEQFFISKRRETEALDNFLHPRQLKSIRAGTTVCEIE